MTQTERDRLIIVEESIKDMDKKLDKIIDDHEQRIRCLESKPGKRWDTIVTVVISNIAIAIITFLVSRFG